MKTAYKDINNEFLRNGREYYFSDIMISFSFYSTLAIGLLLLMFWPFKGSAFFLMNTKAPILFWVVMIVSLFTNGYINLKCGNHEIIKDEYAIIREIIGAPSFTTLGRFLEFLFYDSFLHPLFFLLPHLPIIIVGSAVSGIYLPICLGGVLIIYASSIFCRLLAFNIHLLLGKQALICYILIRSIIIFCLIFTAQASHYLNPFSQIHTLSRLTIESGARLPEPFYYFLLTITTLIGFLSLLPISLVYIYTRVWRKGSITQ